LTNKFPSLERPERKEKLEKPKKKLTKSNKMQGKLKENLNAA